MKPAQYNTLNELLAAHSQLTSQLEIIEADLNLKTLAAAMPLLPRHAELKATLSEIEAKLRTMAAQNPELFPDDKKTHATPFGAISFRTNTWLEIEDQAITLQRIKMACRAEEYRVGEMNRGYADIGNPTREFPRYTETTLIRTSETPNIEALELLSDVELKTIFGIERKHEEKFSVKPLEVKADKLAKKSKPEMKKAG